jgi:hypothetical protein
MRRSNLREIINLALVAAALIGVGACQPAPQPPATAQAETERPPVDKGARQQTVQRLVLPGELKPATVAAPQSPTPAPALAPPASEPSTASPPAPQPHVAVAKVESPRATQPEPAAAAKALPPAVAPAEPPKLPDLGPPLVDNLETLIRLDPVYPVWVDPAQKRVLLVGQVSRPDYRLEFFACSDLGRDYESVVVVNTKASFVHAGLLAIGAEPGHPVQFEPEYKPATGQEIQVDVVWKDGNGQRQRAKAQDWVRNTQTKKALDDEWVFSGSGFWRDPTTGKERYLADSGELICMLSLPGATMDLTIRSPSDLESRLFEAWIERIPPRGTPVTLILTPRAKALSKSPAGSPATVGPKSGSKPSAKGGEKKVP